MAFPPAFRALGSGYWLSVPIPVYLMFGFLALGIVFARYTTWGQEIYAIGANPVAARLSGVPVNRRLVLVYTVSGAMAGLASLIFLARLNSAEGDIGEPLTLPAIAAVLIGGTSLFGGVGTVTGTLVGALILTLVLNGMNLLAIDANWQPLVTGAIVILAVALDVLTRAAERQNDDPTGISRGGEKMILRSVVSPGHRRCGCPRACGTRTARRSRCSPRTRPTRFSRRSGSAPTTPPSR